MKPEASLAIRLHPIRNARWLVVTTVLLAAACATPGDGVGTVAGAVRTTGVVVSIDTQPWTYDGNAIVQVETADQGRLDVQLPARWNLCQAAAVDVEALAVGMHVEVAGTASGGGRVVVCEDPSHRLAPVDAASSANNGATLGGDGSAIELTPLTGADIESAELAGELACSFALQAGASPLLLANGNVASAAPSRGVVKVGSYVEAVAAAGGFDGMLRGARFSGAGKVILVERTGPAIGGGESPPSPATLTYQRADGAQRTFAGQWQCGP